MLVLVRPLRATGDFGPFGAKKPKVQTRVKSEQPPSSAAAVLKFPFTIQTARMLTILALILGIVEILLSIQVL